MERATASGVIFATGLYYFAAVFVVAFAMGVARILLVAPRLGPTAAILIEIPVLIAISWTIARRLFRSKNLALAQRAAAGTLAFTLTLASEATFASLLRGQNVIMWAAEVLTPIGLVGLAGQIVFGALPMFISRDHKILH